MHYTRDNFLEDSQTHLVNNIQLHTCLLETALEHSPGNAPPPATLLYRMYVCLLL